jgi:hypothetical protein
MNRKDRNDSNQASIRSESVLPCFHWLPRVEPQLIEAPYKGEWQGPSSRIEREVLFSLALVAGDEVLFMAVNRIVRCEAGGRIHAASSGFMNFTYSGPSPTEAAVRIAPVSSGAKMTYAKMKQSSASASIRSPRRNVCL